MLVVVKSDEGLAHSRLGDLHSRVDRELGLALDANNVAFCLADLSDDSAINGIDSLVEE